MTDPRPTNAPPLMVEMDVGEKARAKVNLTLHVGPAREDGYHPVHSLVVFADIADELYFEPAEKFSLKSKGPFAKDLPPPADNLILELTKAMAKFNEVPTRLAFTLTKKIPVASGLGGGSADAAAALRLQARANFTSWDEHAESFAVFGADIPVCFLSRTAIMQGIGEEIMPFPGLGQLPAILVNPGVGLATADVFGMFDLVGASSPFSLSMGSLLDMAKDGRNDLQPIAIRLEPVIGEVLDVIAEKDGCQLARMSGSGATCFGLFPSMAKAKAAVRAIKKAHKDWWVVATLLGDKP